MENPKPSDNTLKTKLIAVLALVLVFLCILLWVQYRHIQRTTGIRAAALHLSSLRQHRLLGPEDVSSIQSWMTFGYIGLSFKVPTDSIKSALNLDDPKYPNISISHYARLHAIDATTLTQSVQTMVAKYLTE